MSHKEAVVAKPTKRNRPSEQRKRRLARDSEGIIPQQSSIDPKYKSLVKRKVYNLSSIGHEQYDKLVAQLMQEDDENHNNFEPEKEESTSEDSTSGGSDDVLLCPGFVQLKDRKSGQMKKTSEI
jgi:hypothetical protein